MAKCSTEAGDAPRPAVAVTVVAFFNAAESRCAGSDGGGGVTVSPPVQSAFVAVGAGSWVRTFNVKTGQLISAAHCL
jgi:hypothetical protein